MAETQKNGDSSLDLNQWDQLDEDALRTMFAIELSGQAFYAALAGKVDNQEAAKLLGNNGREEAGHARRLLRALSLKVGHDVDPTPEMLTPGTIPLPDSISPGLFSTILEAELDGDVSYQRWAENEPNPEVARLLQLNGREESIHANRVEQVLTLLTPSFGSLGSA
ncbi:MAG TPA: ferritin family protein [Acidimicrobiales bacterium]|nr:ferritin family protein [Acidimicrobiales bacterium]